MPRAGLTTDVVVASAADLADQQGIGALTLTALADRFGVAVPSLYKHVDGIEDVRRRLAAHAVRQLAEVLLDAAAGRNGRDALEAVAHAYRAFGHTHPGRYAATLRAPAPADAEHLAASNAALGTVLGILEGYGLHGDDALDAARAVRAALHGFVALEQAGGFGLPRGVDRSFEQLVRGLHHALIAWPRSG